jgi:hypothetical protein
MLRRLRCTTLHTVVQPVCLDLNYSAEAMTEFATVDSNLVTPYLPTVQSIVTQVSLFQRYLAPKPAAAKWTSDDSLFAFWIGINDVGNSFYWVSHFT